MAHGTKERVEDGRAQLRRVGVARCSLLHHQIRPGFAAAVRASYDLVGVLDRHQGGDASTSRLSIPDWNIERQ
jgi:hypothetical protein